MHHLGHFWLIFAIVRHPVAGLIALAIAAVFGVLSVIWRRS